MQQNGTLGGILGMTNRLVALHMGDVFPDLCLQRLDNLAYLGAIVM